MSEELDNEIKSLLAERLFEAVSINEAAQMIKKIAEVEAEKIFASMSEDEKNQFYEDFIK